MIRLMFLKWVWKECDSREFRRTKRDVQEFRCIIHCTGEHFLWSDASHARRWPMVAGFEDLPTLSGKVWTTRILGEKRKIHFTALNSINCYLAHEYRCSNRKSCNSCGSLYIFNLVRLQNFLFPASEHHIMGYPSGGRFQAKSTGNMRGSILSCLASRQSRLSAAH